MKRLLAASVCLLLGACAPLSTRGTTTMRSYRLQGSALQQAAPGVAPTVINVLPVDAGPGLDGQAMLYSPLPGELLPYRDSVWLTPPPALVRAALADTLARQRWVAAVQQDVALAPAPWLLHCDLTRLEHDDWRPPGAVRLTLRCELVREPDGAIAAHWDSALRQPLAVADAAHYAAATQQLLDQALAQALAHIAGALRAD